MPQAPKPTLIFLGLVTIQVCFGINYIASKLMVEAFPPLVWAGIRCASATVLLALLAVFLRRPRPKGMPFYRSAFFFSLLAIVFNQGAFLVGLHYTTPTNSAILNTLIPVFTLAAVTLFGHEQLTRRKSASFVAALTGVLILLHVERLELGSRTLYGDLLTLANSLSYGLYLAFSKRFIEKYDRVWITVWLFAFGGVGLNLAALPSWLTLTPPHMTPGLWAAAIYVILGGTFAAYLLTNVMLAHVEASRVALFVYIQPVIAALLACFFLSEQLTIRTLIGSLFIFVGVFLASRPTPLSEIPAVA